MTTLVLPEKIDVAETLLQLEKDRCESDLAYFIRKAWHIVEPETTYVEGWHVKLIAMHLEAITNGEEIDDRPYNRLLINVPPGMMKSLLVNVFWPAWEWGPKNKPSMRYLLVSHKIDLPIQNAGKLRRLLASEWYQKRWPIELRDDQNAKTKYENTKTGFVAATAARSITGQRGDRIVLDDAMSWDDANSEQTRNTTIEWFLGALPTRLNSPVKSAIVVIEQRLHEEDISGTILDRQLGYDHIRLPMEFDETFPMDPTLLGVTDPRTKPGELLFPERFPAQTIERDKKILSPYEVAGQYQQVPIPKGGGIIQRDWWQGWEEEQFPELDYILASLDTAYGEKQENDFSAMTIWGVFTLANKASELATRALSRYGTQHQIERVYNESAPHVILLFAWRERLPFHQLVQKTLKECRRFKVDRLLVEDKAAGLSVIQELRRITLAEEFGIQAITPKGDKWQRLHSVSHLWQEGMIHAPSAGPVWREYAEMVIREVEVFPKGKHDDLTDTVSMAAKFLRDNGLLTRAPERLQEIEDSKRWLGRAPAPLYPS